MVNRKSECSKDLHILLDSYLQRRLAPLNTPSNDGAVRPAVSFSDGAATTAPPIASAPIPPSAAAVAYSDIHSTRTDTDSNLRERGRKGGKDKGDGRQAENNSFSHVNS
jgi:hypothetical protein